MGENRELSALLARYIAGSEDLPAVQEYVTLHFCGVPNELLDHVAMEIWQFQDGYVPEDELRSRLAVILAESRVASSLASD